jgi:hypothetical protein
MVSVWLSQAVGCTAAGLWLHGQGTTNLRHYKLIDMSAQLIKHTRDGLARAVVFAAAAPLDDASVAATEAERGPSPAAAARMAADEMSYTSSRACE